MHSHETAFVCECRIFHSTFFLLLCNFICKHTGIGYILFLHVPPGGFKRGDVEHFHSIYFHYIVRSYKDVIVVTNTATRRTNKVLSFVMY